MNDWQGSGFGRKYPDRESARLPVWLPLDDARGWATRSYRAGVLVGVVRVSAVALIGAVAVWWLA